ncbi:MAG: hypothetical protein M1812_008153 [Candelaria pacifica]|nr:MAG: hypothetical protein M1812_008153 [Candelaria pacifica]
MGGSEQKRPWREGPMDSENTVINTQEHHAHLIARQEQAAAEEDPLLVSRGLGSKVDAAGDSGPLVSRIAESASGLSKGFLMASAAHDLSSVAATEQSSSSKGSVLISSSESSDWAQHSEPSRSSRKTRSHATEPDQTFRSTFDKVSGEQDFLRYLSQANSPSLGLGEPLQVCPLGPQGLPVLGSEEIHFQTLEDTEARHQSYHPSVSAYTSSEAQFVNLNDGAEVVALLSNPELGTEETPLSSFSIAEDQVDIDDLFRSGTSRLELGAYEALKAKLPAAPKHNAPSPSNPLNLIPHRGWFDTEILSFSKTIENDKENRTASFESDAMAMEYYSGWEGVLSRYTDEVWGDLLPIVKEARADIKHVLEGAQPLEPKAAQRLKMILGHLRERTFP